MRGYIENVRVGAASLTLTLQGDQVVGARCELIGGTRQEKVVGRSRRVRLPLPGGLADASLAVDQAAAAGDSSGGGMKSEMVAIVAEISLDDLGRHGLPEARPLLRLLSCYCPAAPIPLRLLEARQLDALLATVATAEPEHSASRRDWTLRACRVWGYSTR